MNMQLYKRFCQEEFNEHGTLTRFSIHHPDNFNFAYDVMDVLAAEEPDSEALVWCNVAGEERRFTYGELGELSNRTANALRRAGVNKGDRVMLMLKRHHEYWTTILALHKLGAVAVPATHMLTVKDIVYRVQAASIKAVVCTPEGELADYVAEARKACPTLTIPCIVRQPKEGFLFLDEAVQAASPVLERTDTLATDPMIMYFTSGTTGYPKMVWHDFTYPLGHILTGCFWHRVEDGGLHFTISDTGWGKALWGKIYGQWLGGSAVFTYDFDRFHAPEILHMMEKYRVTTFCAPPTMYRYMIKEDLSQYDLSALKHCTTAGEALNPEVYNQWFKKTGLKIFEGFGQTETTLCCLTAYPWMQPRLGSMGLPAPGWRLVICDANDEEVPAGVTGEICVRTDGGKPFGLFGGYFRDEELTRKAWHDDLYHTGDTAYKDELGFLWYVGRVDDVIKSSGYRIGPFEVESALMEHPSVLECAVTGVPDPVRGFVVKATIVLARGYEGSPELTKELQNHVKRVTAPYKYPRIIEYVDELPKTISGKIRRVEIRQNDMAKHQADKPK